MPARLWPPRRSWPCRAVSAAARDLTVVARGPTQEAIKEVFVRPFTAATAIAVQIEGWEGGIDALRTQAKAPDNTWDLVMVDSDELATGCSRGPVREARLVGDRRQGPLPAAGGQRLRRRRRRRQPRCWPGIATSSPRTPGWADFWDVAKYPGKRGLHSGVRGNLEFALFADGVAPGDVYKVLATRKASIARSASSTSSSRTSCGGRTMPRRRASSRRATC